MVVKCGGVEWGCQVSTQLDRQAFVIDKVEQILKEVPDQEDLHALSVLEVRWRGIVSVTQYISQSVSLVVSQLISSTFLLLCL